MKITVTVPPESAADYLREIADQLEDGCTSGYWNQETYWESEGSEQ